MTGLIKIWKVALAIIGKHFLPFVLFWIVILSIKIFPLGALWSASFINAETAVRFWMIRGYSFLTGVSVCIICGNIDLWMWFFFFRKGRYLIETSYPAIGKWIIKDFTNNFLISNNSRETTKPDRSDENIISKHLTSVFSKSPWLGLILIGFTPVLDIVLGVPIAVAYNVPHAYFFMAIGNSLKIIIFGYIISHNWLLLGTLIILSVIWIFTKIKTR